MKSGFGFLNWNGFLGGEIRYRISRLIRGLQFRNPDFPIKRNPEVKK